MNHFRSNSLRGLALCLFLTVAAPLVQAAETPPTLSGATVVSAEQVKALMAKGVPVIDTRVANEYADSHIVGAISVPYKEKSAKATTFDGAADSFDLSKLPKDKAAPLVFYCNSGECWKSYKASVTAIKSGYKAVSWFRGGFPEWKAKGFPTE